MRKTFNNLGSGIDGVLRCMEPAEQVIEEKKEQGRTKLT